MEMMVHRAQNNSYEKTALIETPLRIDAFAMNNKLKISLIEEHYREIMKILGLDLENDSLKGTPKRVAKMMVEEAFAGLDPSKKPETTLFDNDYNYNQMLVSKDISLYTYCEHHFVPIIGKVHVAYFSAGKVIGLSKLNRLVNYYAKRPQVQERLTVQIAEGIKEAMQIEDVAVMVDALHLCVASRGIKDTNSTTVTSSFSGRFEDPAVKAEFFSMVK
jgi:GTP cyclohydrolase IA